MERGTRAKDHMTASYALSLAAVFRAQASSVCVFVFGGSGLGWGVRAATRSRWRRSSRRAPGRARPAGQRRHCVPRALAGAVLGPEQKRAPAPGLVLLIGASQMAPSLPPPTLGAGLTQVAS